MERELATQEWDLPHAFTAASRLPTTKPSKARCQCGREKADELHAERLVERAAEVVPLERELGI